MRSIVGSSALSRRFVGAAALGVLALLLLVVPASAGVLWCRTDPVVEVNGFRANVYVSTESSYLSTVNGPVRLDVHVPVGATARLIQTDSGFGQGYTIRFIEDARLHSGKGFVEMIASVYVGSSSSNMPVKVDIVPVDPAKCGVSKRSTANQWIATGTTRI